MSMLHDDNLTPATLRRMQTLVQRIWTPHAQFHIGDLAWSRSRPPSPETPSPVATWTADGADRAWGWLLPPAELYLAIDPAYPRLLTEVLAWFAAQTPGATRREIPVTIGTDLLETLLPAAGYHSDTDPDAPFFVVNGRALADLPPVPTVPGYRFRPVTRAEVATRAGVHQAAFTPSRVTTETYAAVMATWPYSLDLDWVAEEVATGVLAASCLIWLDAENQVGELEPVGTHPGHQRRGLGYAVCLAALHALRDAGATRAMVLNRGGPLGLGAKRLYAALGFQPLTEIHNYVMEVDLTQQ